MRKRGQFFLLAAVIISAAIISLNVGTNRVTTNEEPGDFYDFGQEVKREVGSVLDYKVYNVTDLNVDLDAFIVALAEEIEERSPGSEFIFIYGNGTNMQLKNYGTQDVYANGQNIPGTQNTFGQICLGNTCQNITGSGKISPTNFTPVSRAGSTDVLVDIGGTSVSFPSSKYNQVIFVMQKNIGGDRYVIIE